ncbi:MoaD/ThiS family protein [Arcanobacterium phocae]|uniref:MoaD/ThiS family protein n=1 Tax=Arcanobacterium phocae TaxID=131112 RepID=UPI001C0EAEC7|nr:MoaD/ThiS family protein [Arcanobacterium phocae]
MSKTVLMRYFAGIADTAGISQETVELSPDATVADLANTLSALHGEQFRLNLAVCALISSGRRLQDDDPLLDGAEIDALPPFAGG